MSKKELKRYDVTWQIDIWAYDTVMAAEEALKIQRHVESGATVFLVKPERGDPVEIDLETGEIKHPGKEIPNHGEKKAGGS